MSLIPSKDLLNDMTQRNEGPFYIRSKIWFEDASGEVIFGIGRLKMLEAIDRNGSIQAAAKELKMSYRALWGRITATENRMGRQLLTRNIGVAAGCGSQLLNAASNGNPPALPAGKR